MTSLVSAEKTDYQKSSLHYYLRFLRDLTLFRILFIPSLFLSLIAVTIPQLFLYLSGKLSQCDLTVTCSAELPWVGEIPVSIALLLLVFVSGFMLRFISWSLFEISGEISATSVHSKMVHSLSRTRVTYFDENPSGRLLNRLIRDWDSLRTEGIMHLSDATQAFLELIATALLSLFSSIVATLLIIPLLIYYIFVQINIGPMLMELAVIRSKKLGNVLHRYTDFVEGVRTFLIYDKVKELTRRLAEASHEYLQAHLVRARVENIGFIQTGFATALYGFIVILFAAYALHIGEISETLAAVIMTVAFRIPPLANIFIWHSVYLIESMGLARRVYEIIDLLPEEKEEGVKRQSSQRIQTHGNIQFLNYSMSYRQDTPRILNELNFTIVHGERLGIIGRTGAGKTSILQSLLRMVHVQAGDITIAGNSIFDFTPTEVRDLVTVVPQDPYLFEGTIATNLSREKKYKDSELRSALESVGLTLDPNALVLEGGKNLSLGERQLVCLARALIQDRPILFLDEPTSGIDTISDALIQRVLTEEFKGVTVITIAHRLDTLRRYDRVILMEEGKVKLSGTPVEMISRISERDLE